MLVFATRIVSSVMTYESSSVGPVSAAAPTVVLLGYGAPL